MDSELAGHLWSRHYYVFQSPFPEAWFDFTFGFNFHYLDSEIGMCVFICCVAFLERSIYHIVFATGTSAYKHWYFVGVYVLHSIEISFFFLIIIFY